MPTGPDNTTSHESSPSTDPAVLLVNQLDSVVLKLMQPRQESLSDFWKVAISALAQDASFTPDAAFEAVAKDTQVENVVRYVSGIRAQTIGEMTAHPTGSFEIDLRYVSPSEVAERARTQTQPLVGKIGDVLQQHITDQQVLGEVMHDMQGLFAALESITSANAAGREQMGRTLILQALSGGVPLNVSSGVLLGSEKYRPFFPANTQISDTVTLTVIIPSKIPDVGLKVDIHAGQIVREVLVVKRTPGK